MTVPIAVLRNMREARAVLNSLQQQAAALGIDTTGLTSAEVATSIAMRVRAHGWLYTDGTHAAENALLLQTVLDATNGDAYTRRTHIHLPAGIIAVDASLDLTDCRAVTISGAGVDSTILLSSAAGKAALDLSGSRMICLRDFTVKGHASSSPRFGVAGTRTTAASGLNAGEYQFDLIGFDGTFTDAACYMAATECSNLARVMVRSSAIVPIGIWLGAYNGLDFVSEFATATDSSPSMSTVSVRDCELMLFGHATAVPVVLGRHTSNVAIIGGYFAGNAAAEATILVDGDCDMLRVQNVAIEQNCPDNIKLCYNAEAAYQTQNNTWIEGVGASGFTRAAVYAEAGTTQSCLTLRHLRNGQPPDDSIVRLDDCTDCDFSCISVNSAVQVKVRALAHSVVKAHNVTHRGDAWVDCYDTRGELIVPDAISAIEKLSNGNFSTAGGSYPSVWANWTQDRNVTYGDVTDETVFTHSPGHSVKLTNKQAGAGYARIQQTFTAVPGADYSLTYWAAGDGTGCAAHRVYDGTHSADIVAATANDVTAHEWSQVTVPFTAPSGCTQITIELWAPLSGVTDAWVDDVSVLTVPAP